LLTAPVAISHPIPRPASLVDRSQQRVDSDTFHVAGVYSSDDKATPFELSAAIRKASSTLRTGTTALRKLITSDSTAANRTLESISVVLGVRDVRVDDLRGSYVFAIVSHVAFIDFTELSFTTAAPSPPLEPHIRRAQCIADYDRVFVMSPTDSLQNEAEFAHWLLQRCAQLSPMLGLPAASIVPVIREGMKYVWCLQRLYHAFKAQPILIQRAHGDVFDFPTSASQEFLDEPSQADSVGNTGHAALVRRAHRFVVKYMTFPGFYLDDAVLTQCMVEVQLK
jgi:hypothetical protein